MIKIVFRYYKPEHPAMRQEAYHYVEGPLHAGDYVTLPGMTRWKVTSAEFDATVQRWYVDLVSS